MKVKDIYPQWVSNKKFFVKKSTLSAYTLLYENHILPSFGEYESITKDIVQDYVLYKVDAGLSHKTVKDTLIVLKMILEFGDEKGLFDYKRWNVKYPQNHTKKEVKVLSKDDHKKVMDYVLKNMTFRNLGVYISLSAGLRIGEVCGLKWGDIDLENKVINVNRTVQRIYVVENGIRKTEVIIDTPKTRNSIREIPMTKDLVNVAKHLIKVMNEEFYILSNTEKPDEPRTYRSYYKNFMDKLGLPVINYHGLRHSFATRCIESGLDVKTTSVMLGHSNISTTLNLYVHPSRDQKQQAINKVFK